jgi:CheY-like chemotaxis protein
LRELRILLVEGDEVIGTLLAEMLMSMGHSVGAIRATETKAVAAVAFHAPDFMIVDAHLRDGSGISAMRTISREQSVPHLFVSGVSAKPDRLGAEVLMKPFRDRDSSKQYCALAAARTQQITKA